MGRSPSGQEEHRTIVGLGKETSTDITGYTSPGSGATLRIITNGMISVDRTYTLAASGWASAGQGYKYTGPTTDDPVKKVLIKLTEGGVAVIKIIVKGNVGMEDVENVPPDLGTDGGFILQLATGDRFCVAFGGAAGGVSFRNDATQWKIINATGQPGCPGSATTTSTSSTTYPPCGSAAAPMCDGTCPDGELCFTSGSGCVCLFETEACGFDPPNCYGLCAGGGPCISDGGSGCMCALGTSSSTTTSTSSTSSTTSGTHPPCGSAAFPMCDGTCASGEFCIANIGPPFDCYCLADSTPCGIAPPNCFGACGGGGQCVSDGGSGCMCAP